MDDLQAELERCARAVVDARDNVDGLGMLRDLFEILSDRIAELDAALIDIDVRRVTDG
jgi:hypothetical protein